jgi:hypothetical protein
MRKPFGTGKLAAATPARVFIIMWWKGQAATTKNEEHTALSIYSGKRTDR